MGFRTIVGDITEIKADAVVSAANAKGYMGGWLGRYVRLRGVAESIHYVTRGAVATEAKQVVRRHRPGLGDVYVTRAYNLSADWVIHAVTMLRPGLRSNLTVVERCIENVLSASETLGVHVIAVPLLGTGTGRVPISEVEALYERKFTFRDDLDIIIVRPGKE